jgi:adenylate cyclase
LKSRFTISIRTILTVGFGGLTAVGIVVALVIGLGAAFHNTKDLLTRQADGIVSRITSEIYHKLNPAERQAQWIAARTLEDKLPFRELDYDRLAEFFGTALSAAPQVAGAAFFTLEGKQYQWFRDGNKVTPLDWSDRKVAMDWINNGRTKPPSDWGPPIWLDTVDAAVIAYEMPLFDSQGYLGYLVLAVPISGLSAQLTKISPNPFILFGKSDVLAHPSMIDWRPPEPRTMEQNVGIYAGQSALMALKDLGDPVLERIWTADHQDLAILENMANSKAVAADIGDRQYVFLFRSIDDYGPRPWIVGTYMDVEHENPVFRRMGGAAGFGVGVLIIAVIASLYLARAIGRPIRQLSNASAVVKGGKFDQIPELPGSHILEFDQAMNSFKGMVDGLAERDMIRRTLGRYVPEQVAEILLRDDGGLAPTEAEATVLFCDVAGFTALTETLGPIRIVEVLNAYFSRMTEILEAYGGVVTQFQGDAILAIFNVPIQANDHAEQACNAGVQMRHAVKTEVFSGQSLHNRIGINTGSVVAGAVGAEGRLTYTVHGDAVNRAARLESLNKDMGTFILISESTAQLVKKLKLTKVGESEVRGQQGGVTLYGIDDDAK